MIWLVAVDNYASELGDLAREFKAELVEKVMPYWHDTTLDQTNGGYLLADDLRALRTATEKQLVTQSRLVWTFSHAAQHGLADGKRDYLKAARNGYQFLSRYFLDPANGGYFWKTDLAGKPINDGKFLYGQSFVIYALVEYYRTSHDEEALRMAMELYAKVQAHCYDRVNGGWLEHTERDWRALKAGDPRNEVEIVGLKSANAHLHWMEALTELYEVTRDAAVKLSLNEALQINSTIFYPIDPAKSCFHRQLDWKPVTDPRSAGLSYGHNVEFAWLMVRAEHVMAQKASWDHYHAIMGHALKYGYDHERGGLYNRGFDNQPANDTSKVWWAQAEMLAALTDGLKRKKNPAYSDALLKLLRFVRKYQTDPRDGVWLDTVTAEGSPQTTAKAHNWKANYHDVRGLVKFVETFLPLEDERVRQQRQFGR
jgi:mannobiose 2-epimerase